MSSSLVINAGCKELTKFRGCLIGSLIGDCLGAPFEFDNYVSKRVLGNYLRELQNKDHNQKFSYTDDTAMTLSVARSLVEHKKVDVKDLAKRFVAEFFQQPHRGYGANVVNVFDALQQSQFQDVFLPAKLQFNGSGSYGNGAAMRIAPLALFSHKKDENFVKNSTENISHITHSHPNGYNGAILQCLAIQAALNSDPSSTLDPVEFISSLENKMKAIEKNITDTPYCESLKKIKNIFLKEQNDISSEEIAHYLGNSVSALESVPTAIYCFLRGLCKIENFECLLPVVRTIYLAISVGGDTDTIASMAGSIAGAFHGAEAIPATLYERCESFEEITSLAEKLFNQHADL